MVMRVFNPGDVLAAADVNEQLVNTKYAIKPADTSRASTTTLANDPDLTVSVDANKTYYVQVTIIYTAVSGSGDLKFAWTVPAGTVFSGTVMNDATTVNMGAYQAGGTLISQTQSFVGGGASILASAFSGVLAIGGSSGSFTLQWAQQTSNVTATVVKQGSHMFLRRVA